MAHQAGAYPGFRGMKRLGIFPPWMGCQSIAGLPPALNSPVPIYTPGWREAPWELSVLPKNTTQRPRPGLEPGALAPESSALTMRPPRLPKGILFFTDFMGILKSVKKKQKMYRSYFLSKDAQKISQYKRYTNILSRLKSKKQERYHAILKVQG